MNYHIIHIMEKTFDFNLKDGGKKTMGFDEFVRWMCLVESLEVISKACDDRNIKASDTNWIKPLAIQNYIDERYHSMRHDLTVEVALGNL